MSMTSSRIAPVKAKTHADAAVLKFRPQDARRIKELERLVDRHPLLRARDAGAVLRLGALAAGDLVDERRLANVRDAEHHHAQHAADLALGLVRGDLIAQQRAHGGRKLLHAPALLGVRFDDGVAERAEIRRPLFRHLRVGLIDAVQNDQTGLARRQLVHIGVAAAHRDARVQNFAHGVHVAELRRDHAAGLGHVPREPAQRIQLHLLVPLYCKRPMRPNSRCSVR